MTAVFVEPQPMLEIKVESLALSIEAYVVDIVKKSKGLVTSKM